MPAYLVFDSSLNSQVWHVLTRDHTVLLPPTRLSTSGMNHTCLYFQLQCITALWLVLISRPTEGRRLSWPDVSMQLNHSA